MPATCSTKPAAGRLRLPSHLQAATLDSRRAAWPFYANPRSLRNHAHQDAGSSDGDVLGGAGSPGFSDPAFAKLGATAKVRITGATYTAFLTNSRRVWLVCSSSISAFP